MYRLMCLTVGLVAIAACNFLSDPKRSDCGMFGGRASGAAADSLAGCAVFAIEPEFGKFGMMLTNGTLESPSQAVKVFRAGRPGLGIHQVNEFDFLGVIVLGNTTYDLTAGTVTVTQTEAHVVSGSLILTGTNQAGVSVTISGSCVARCTGQAPVQNGVDPGDEKKSFCTARAAG